MARARTGGSESVSTPLQKRKRREAWLTLGATLGIALLLLGLISSYLWLSWQRVYWAEQVTETRTQLQQARIENDYLQAQVSSAFSLDRLARYAVQTLGMVEPELHYWPPQP